MSDLDDLELLVNTRTPLLLIDTSEAGRVEELFRRIATRTGRPLFSWSLATGLRRIDGGSAGAKLEPAALLAQILGHSEPGLYLLHDLHRYLKEPLVLSQLQALALKNPVPPTLVLVGASLELPTELRHCAARLELSAPSREELEQLIKDEAADWGARNQKRVQARQEVIDALVRNLAGMSLAEARRLVRHAIHDDGVLDQSDLPGIQSAKYKLLDTGGVLSFELDVASPDDVAGLSNLKRWLGQRRDVFLSAKAPRGLDPPKGLLLLGVQGGGKSLAAKSVAGAWGVPLLRLDFAALYDKYYGETERNLREALKTASSMAPCVLWIDEIEKGLAQESDGGGPGKRLLGTLLTWMAERKDKVFLVATANDIEALPPELLRKGRFDEIFFVDLPSPAAREAIFAIHLRKRGQDAKAFDLAALAAASEGFSGAEIEQGVVSALYAAHAKGEPLATALVESELRATRPLSVVMAERMASLRGWAKERTVPADSCRESEGRATSHDTSGL